MRADSAAFAAYNRAAAKNPRYVIAVLFDVGSVYFTSHVGIPSVPGIVVAGVVREPSAISQLIVPDEGRSEIGSFDFSLVDVASAVTQVLRDKLQIDEVSFREKQVRFYVGYEGQDFTAFQLFTTQIVKDIDFAEDGTYNVKCQDITREQREEIFDPKKTTLRDTVDATAATIPVYTTTGFQTVGHGPSFSDGPNAAVGYIQLEDEKIRYTGKTSDSFTGCTRGVLNTKAVTHTVDPGADADRRPKVAEVIYLELPAAKIARAVQTGEISPNYVGNGGFETDTDANGVSDGWNVSVGSTGDAGRTHTISRVTGLTVGSSNAQRVEITAATNANDSVLGSSSNSVRIPCGPGTLLPDNTTYIASAYVRTNATSKVKILVRPRSAGGTLLGDQSSATHPGGSTTVQLTKSATVPSLATTIEVQVRGTTAVGEWFEVDDIQLQVGSTPTAYAEGPRASASNELPSHWHCGIDPQLVRTSDFVGIGSDLWNTRLDTEGFVTRFESLTKTNGKKFLEAELCMLLGCYQHVYSDGTVGLKRMNPVLVDAAYVVELNNSNCVEWTALEHDFSGMHNRLLIGWNWNGKEFTRQTLFVDANSIAIYGAAPIKKLQFKGLHGSRHTEAIIRQRIDAFRQRYSAPPQRFSVTVLPSLNQIEVGDIDRVRLENVRDYVGNSAGIDRSFEIQRKSENHATGNVTLELFASTARASVLPPNDTGGGSALPDAFYGATGTNLTTVCTIVLVGPVGVIQPGTYNLPAGVYYYAGDLELANGATLTINGTVQINVRGFFTINGDIDGIGRGKAGVASAGGWNVLTPGLAGFVGSSRGMDGVVVSPQPFPVSFGLAKSQPAAFTQGQHPSFPELTLTVSGNSLLGIPGDLSGTSGGAGGHVGRANAGDFISGTVTGNGGTGADSGAGLAIVCRGMTLGASGSIDLSGEDAAATVAVNSPWGQGGSAYPGAGGAGGPGALLIALDGSSLSVPDLGGKFIATCGVVPINGSTMFERGPTFLQTLTEHGWIPPVAGYEDETIISAVDLSNVAYRIQYIPGVETPQEDNPAIPPAPAVLFVEATVEAVRLRIGGVALEDVDLVQFWSSPTNDRTVATLAAEGRFLDTVFPILDQQIRFYWSRTGLRGQNNRIVYSDFEPSDPNGGATNSPLRGNFFCPDAEFARATDDTYWKRSNASKMVISPTGGTYAGYLTMDFSAPEEGGARLLQPRINLLPIVSGQSVSVRVRVRRSAAFLNAVTPRLAFDIYTFDDPNEAFTAPFTLEGFHTLIEDLNALPLSTWQEFAMTVPTSALTRTFCRVRLRGELLGDLGDKSGLLDIDYFQAQLDTPVFAENSAGLVPKPTATIVGQQKLRDDGTWVYDQPISTGETAGNITDFNRDPGNILRYGADPTGANPSDTAVARCQAAGYRCYAPRGTYLFNSTIAVRAPGFIGDGPNQTFLQFVGVDAFTLAKNEGINRPACIIGGFSVDGSTATNCQGKYFFFAPGVLASEAAIYNMGINVRDVEVGRNNKFGGMFYLKDVFRMNVKDVGGTDVSNMIRIVGSVVQCKFQNITSNNDSAAATIAKKGITTEVATYSSGATTLTPENIRFIDCSYIRGSTGFEHQAGLLIAIENFDCEVSQIGMLLNAECRVTGGLVAPQPGTSVWTGIFRGVNPSNDDAATIIDGVDVNCLNTPSTPASSYGIDAGDGVSPVLGLVIRNCRIRGSANAVASAFRGRLLSDFTFEDNFIRTSTVNGANDVSITGTRLFLRRNRNDGGVWSITDSGAAAYGEISNNKITTLTFNPTTPMNWTYGINETIGTARCAQETGSFTATLTGCTTSPTGTIRWIKNGNFVTLYIPSITGTSNATTATLTGMPATLVPARQQDCVGKATDNGLNGLCNYRIRADAVIEMFFGTGFAAFTNSGTKGTSLVTISYSIE